MKFRLQKMHLGSFRFLSPQGRRLLEDYYREVVDPAREGRQM
jgi:hypothetical protein